MDSICLEQGTEAKLSVYFLHLSFIFNFILMLIVFSRFLCFSDSNHHWSFDLNNRFVKIFNLKVQTGSCYKLSAVEATQVLGHVLYIMLFTGHQLSAAVVTQYKAIATGTLNAGHVLGKFENYTPDLTQLFKVHKPSFFKRTSSAMWNSPPIKQVRK